MSDEKLTNEKECNCICCRILKSECFKKFLLTVLASFIGCAIAVILFAPKPPKMPCPRFMNGPMMERQLPPPMYHHKDFRGDFKRMHKPPTGEFDRRGPQERFNRPSDFKGRPLPERKDFGNVKPVKDLPLNGNAEE